MTATEIRVLGNPEQAEIPLYQYWILQEIAAQLAELNERLDQLSRVGPDGKGAYFTVEVNQP